LKGIRVLENVEISLILHVKLILVTQVIPLFGILLVKAVYVLELLQNVKVDMPNAEVHAVLPVHIVEQILPVEIFV
jgi:hypothetical protein